MGVCALRRGLTAASKPKQTFLACCDGSAGLWRARGEPASAPLGTSVSSAPSAALSWTGASSSADPHIEKPKYLYGNEVIQYMTDGDPGELWHEKIWNKPLYTEEEEMFEVVSEELQQASLKRRDDKDLQGAYDGAASAKQKCEDMIAAGIVILNTARELEHDAYLDPIPEIDIVKALKVQCEWEMERP